MHSCLHAALCAEEPAGTGKRSLMLHRSGCCCWQRWQASTCCCWGLLRHTGLAFAKSCSIAASESSFHQLTPTHGANCGVLLQVRLLLLAALAGEHLLLLGPPGTAKSELSRRLSKLTGGKYFERLLTRFSVPEVHHGPVCIRWSLHEAAGMLAECWQPLMACTQPH